MKMSTEDKGRRWNERNTKVRKMEATGKKKMGTRAKK